MDFAQHVGKGYGPAWRGILFRETFPQLADVIAKTNKWFHRIFPDARYNGTDHSWTFNGGEVLFLRYMRKPVDYWHYHGHEYPWVGWEELTNWPTSECYEVMKSTNRSSQLGIPRRYRSTANPYGVGHNWVKAYFIDPAPPGTIIKNKDGLERVRVHAHWSENKHLMEADEDYIKKIAADTNENRRKAWLEGDWDIVAGGMFDDLWDGKEHVIAPFPIPKTWRIYRAFDWGSSHPSSVGWWAESDGTGVGGFAPGAVRGDLIRIDEYYTWNGRPNEGNRMLAKDIARAVVQHEKAHKFKADPGPADSSIFDSDRGTSIADDMAEVGVRWTKADKRPGSRQIGWERMRDRFAAACKRPREEPGIWVFETCQHFIRTSPVLPRDEKKPDDVDTDAEDHVADEARYAILQRDVRAKVRPFRI